MPSYGREDFINISIKYRVSLLILCTLLYLFPIIYSGGEGITLKLGIAFGMLASCCLAIYLYHRILSQPEGERWIKGILFMELFTYGIFTFFSGGFSSPYFWYYMGYLITIMAIQNSIFFTILGLIWCLLCAIASSFIIPQEIFNMEFNLAMGAVIITITFYILLHYLNRVIEHQELHKELNICLQQEKERSEQALKHATNLYDTLNLFAITDPDKIMEELGDTLWRTIAPEGCILVKLSSNGMVENQVLCGIDEQYAPELINMGKEQWISVKQEGKNLVWKEIISPIDFTLFESTKIGKNFPLQGLLIRKKTTRREGELEQDTIYYGLVEIIFRNLDIQYQLEEYIIAEEQHRLADEIHDTVIQKLFGIACGLKILENNMEEFDRDLTIEKLQGIKSSTELIMKDLREAIYGLDFNNGEETFHYKLKNYMQEVKKLTDTDIQLKIDEEVDMMTSAQKVALYRIVCEAVNNAVRHGKAQCVTIEIRLEKKDILATIIDNGSGYIRPQETAPLQGKGLKNIRRMVSMLGGDFTLESEKEQGTIIRLNLPR